MLVPAKALRMNSTLAAARIAARFSMSFGRPGPGVLAWAGQFMGDTLAETASQKAGRTLLYGSVYLFPIPLDATCRQPFRWPCAQCTAMQVACRLPGWRGHRGQCTRTPRPAWLPSIRRGDFRNFGHPPYGRRL